MSADDTANGLVSLVGAGPGDPGLITVAGLARLRAAEVVLYDRLVAPSLVQEAPANAERLYVGKAPHAHAVPQEEIGRILVDRGRAGRRVVRLKGGDPFVFGRGGEEALALADAGVPFEVIPGISSAIAAPAYAGIPITDRTAASSFTVVTGQEDDEKTESSIDWDALARGVETLVVLMGRRSLRRTIARLISAGRPSSTPAAAVHWGTTPRQRTVVATLGTLAKACDRAALEAPVVVIIGSVVDLRARLQWFEQRPLFGQRVLITRTRAQASVLAQRLHEDGAEAIEFPAIEIVPADPEPARAAVHTLAAGSYDWAIFTSANGVRAFWEHVDTAGLDARAFVGTQLAAIGPETAEALRTCGLRADVLPEQFLAESLLTAMSDLHLDGNRILLARAGNARDMLPTTLRARGARVDDLALYIAQRPDTPDADVVARLEAGEIDIATFTASSTVRGCLALLDGRTGLFRNVLVACIGPITAQTARDAGLQVDVVAEQHTIPGLVQALRTHIAGSDSAHSGIAEVQAHA